MSIELPVCRWRGPLLSEGYYTCTSVKLVVPAHGIPEEFCLTCYCIDHEPRPDLVALREAMSKPVESLEVIPRDRCKHLDEKIPARKVVELGLSPSKEWWVCGMGHGNVCPCEACKTCLDWEV